MPSKVTRGQMISLRNTIAPLIGANPERVLIQDHHFNGLKPGQWTLSAEEANYEWPFGEEVRAAIKGALPDGAWAEPVNHYSINIYRS